MSNQLGGFKQTYEKINSMSGGAVGQVADALRETAKDIASSPLDMLKGMFSGDSGSDEDASGNSDPAQTGGGSLSQQNKFAQKVQEKTKEKEEKMAHARARIQEIEEGMRRAAQERIQRERQRLEDMKKQQQETLQQRQTQQQQSQQAAAKQAHNPAAFESGKKQH